ncbi:unnamed protein product [Protopolystoma xenopodis]|uniref:Neurotransmitter-gated ion-channel transmembrane domain-containing protein n=1 Tax=Protopolystoma xenopodis TaxID=117903 RepID=A0A3S5FC50_9PLAT|nr:unnamed protein product [Protopolystoma xenopodis]
MSLTSLSVMMTVFVLNLHHCGPMRHELPRCLRCLIEKPAKTKVSMRQSRIRKRILDYASISPMRRGQHSPIFTTRTVANEHFEEDQIYALENISHHRQHFMPSPRATPVARSLLARNLSMQIALDRSARNMMFISQVYRLLKCMDTSSISGASEEQVMRNSGSQAKRLHYGANRSPTRSHSTEDRRFTHLRNAPSPEGVTSAGLFERSELLRLLLDIDNRRDMEEGETRRIEEWRQVARVMDRTLFWAYLACATFSTLFILVVAPAFQIMPEARLKNEHHISGTNYTLEPV